MHQWLNKHPQVYLPPCKEVHYFDINMHQSIQWYESHFENASKTQQCGEITPFYLFHPQAPQRIKKILPKVKMIILLRDPVERALSQLFHARKRGFETLEPSEALAAEKSRMESGSAYSHQKHSYVSRSKYIEQLDRYEKEFPKDQLLVLKSENMFKQSKDCLNKIEQFLKIKSSDHKEQIPKANEGLDKTYAVSEDLQLRLRNQLMETARSIRQRYGFGWDWDT